MKPDLWEHQRKAIEMAEGRDSLALLMDPGVGKTRTIIEILLRRKGIQSVLVLCPKVVCENWRDELIKYSPIPASDIVILKGSGKSRAATVHAQLGKKKVLITNYQSLLMPEVGQALHNYAADVLICDESHRLKNPNAKTTKAAIQLSTVSKARYLLTGTPILQSMLDVFSQWLVMDGGKTFGKNFFLFRNQYFYDKNAGKSWATWKEWVPKEHSDAIIRAEIAKSAVTAKKEDCLDLPPFVRVPIHVDLSGEQKKHYQEMERELITYINSRACVATIAVTKALRLQQIVSGFLPTIMGIDEQNVDILNENPEIPTLMVGSAQVQNIVFKDNPRLDALYELLDDLKESTQKMIIWACWRENYGQIRDVCESLKLGYTELHGDVNESDRLRAVSSFQQDPACRVFIGNQGAAGIGINLVEASAAIYYSRNFSLEHDIQSEARNYRGGSERHRSVTRYDLVTKDTIDEMVLQSLRDKKEIGNNIINFLGDRWKTHLKR